MTKQSEPVSAAPAKQLGPQSGQTSSGSADRRRTPWGFILPALVPLALITIGPLIFLYYISLTDFELGSSLSEANFVGLDNYVRLFTGKDPQFWPAIVNTLVIAVAATAIELVLGFGIALLVDSKTCQFQRGSDVFGDAVVVFSQQYAHYSIGNPVRASK